MKKIALPLSVLVCGAFAAGPVCAFDAALAPPAGVESSSLVLADSDIDAKTLQAAQSFVDSLAKQGIAFWGNAEISEADRATKFRGLLENSFDMDTISRFVLAQYWKVATPAQKKEYQKLFKEMIVRVYSRRFGEYEGQELEVTSARPEGKHDILVNSKIVPQSGSKIALDWRVREKNGRFQVIDIIVEGVSMALTHRSDFSSVIQRGGGDVEVLLEHLRQN